MYHTGIVVASWSLRQEVAMWQVWALLMTNIFVTEFSAPVHAAIPAWGGVCPSTCWDTHPPVDKILDTYWWKDYFSATTVAHGKNSIMACFTGVFYSRSLKDWESDKRNNPYYFFRANQQKANHKVLHSLAQCDITVNGRDWHILAMWL